VKSYFYLVLLLFIGTACSHSKNDEKPIARVYDRYLYPSDVKGLVMPGLSNHDSIQLLKNYVDEWIRQNLLVAKATDNVDINQKELDKKISDYKESLLIYEYENELIRQKLDTTVTLGQITDYYNQHLSNFELRFDIAKLNYIKIRNNQSDLPVLRRMFNEPQSQGDALSTLCKKSSYQFSLNDSVWFVIDEIGNLLPTSVLNAIPTLKGTTEYKDSSFTYLCKVNAFISKGNKSPIGMVKDNIYKIIVNKRKVEMIKSIREEIFKDALQRGDFESI
jgi:hypothetical protein